MTERFVVLAPNWIGDSVMAMPALQLLRERFPSAEIDLVIKPAVRDLWKFHAAPTRLLLLDTGIGGVARAARELDRRRYEVAYVFPHSVRAALVPFLARIPSRIGRPGRWRRLLLTESRAVPDRLEAEHQAIEYAELLFPSLAPEKVMAVAPSLAIPDSLVMETARERLGGVFAEDGKAIFGLIPGAARGPSKQWPAERYAETGRRLLGRYGGLVALLGTPSEQTLCAEIAEGIGVGAVSLAGQTSFLQMMALLKIMRGVVTNDSGGMHIAAALGTPVVAVFGITDPRKTGPLGSKAVVLQESSLRRRAVPPVSVEATAALERVSVDQVMDAIEALVTKG